MEEDVEERREREARIRKPLQPVYLVSSSSGIIIIVTIMVEVLVLVASNASRSRLSSDLFVSRTAKSTLVPDGDRDSCVASES